MFIQWNPEKHSIDIPLIDNQHKELFLLTNKLNELIGQKQIKNDAIKILKDLYAYTSYHFSSEEGLLEEYENPATEKHKGLHKEFRNKIKETLKEVREKPYFSLEPLQDYLVEWIIKHIQGEDVKYAKYFKENSIKPDVHFTVSSRIRTNILDEWKAKKLKLEIREIDDQHRELIQILQQTNDLQYTSEKRKHIYMPIILKKLFYYTQYHFSYEEEHMSKNNYPQIDDQKQLHKSFIMEIIKIAENYKKGITKLSDEIIIFLKDWVISHILTEDKKYKDFLITLNTEKSEQ